MLNKMLSKIISVVKGEEWHFPEELSGYYILLIFIERIHMFIRGKMKFSSRRNTCFIGYSTKIRFKKLLVFGKNLSIGNNCYVNPLSIEGIQLGNNVSIGNNTNIECSGSYKFLGKGLSVGHNTSLGTHGFYGCAGGVKIGNDVIIGNYVSFHSENHNYKDTIIPIRLQGVNHKGIKVGNNCWIGAKVTFLDGAEIGCGCIIAAGAVVRGSFADNSIIGGVPAKIITTR